MKASLEHALLLTAAGYAFTLPALLHTTPFRMTVFALVGVPCFVAGFIVYSVVVVRDLRRHGVL